MPEKYTADQLRQMSDAVLDEAAARVVMRWQVEESRDGAYKYFTEGGRVRMTSKDAYRFTQDDGAAFVLVDRLRHEGWQFNMIDYPAVTVLGDTRPAYTRAVLRQEKPDSLKILVAEEDNESRQRAITIACILAAQEVGNG